MLRAKFSANFSYASFSAPELHGRKEEEERKKPTHLARVPINLPFFLYGFFFFSQASTIVGREERKWGPLEWQWVIQIGWSERDFSPPPPMLLLRAKGCSRHILSWVYKRRMEMGGEEGREMHSSPPLDPSLPFPPFGFSFHARSIFFSATPFRGSQRADEKNPETIFFFVLRRFTHLYLYGGKGDTERERRCQEKAVKSSSHFSLTNAEGKKERRQVLSSVLKKEKNVCTVCVAAHTHTLLLRSGRGRDPHWTEKSGSGSWFAVEGGGKGGGGGGGEGAFAPFAVRSRAWVEGGREDREERRKREERPPFVRSSIRCFRFLCSSLFFSFLFSFPCKGILSRTQLWDHISSFVFARSIYFVFFSYPQYFRRPN